MKKRKIKIRNIPVHPARRTRKRRLFFMFDYPKLFILILCIILAYIIFRQPIVYNFLSGLNSLSYFGTLIAGMMFAFGFTAPFAVGFFITLQPSNIYLAAFLGGLGALIADLLIFRFVRFSFMDEFERLEKTKTVKKVGKAIERRVGLKFTNYLLYAFTGFVIASPLPDELGVIMLAGLTKINQSILAIVSFTLNTFGIFIILYFSVAG